MENFIGQLTRKQKRSLIQAKPHHNKSSFFGIPKQVIQLENGKHKVIIHKPSKSVK
jgi:hypothetical protein